MKTKIIKIIILLLIFLISVFIINNQKKPIKCKILGVIEADEFYIDFNNNGIIDNFEHAKLKDIKAFQPIKTNYTKQLSKELGISEEQLLTTGYLARAWAIENLKYKDVLINKIEKSSKDQLSKVQIFYKNEDLAKTLLKNGLAYLPKENKTKEYFHFENILETKNISKKLKQLNFLLLNLHSNILHTLECEHINKISKAELILKNKTTNSQIFCKKCLEEKIKYEKLHLSIPKSKNVYKKSFFKSYNNLDLYFINPLEYNKPNPTCTTVFCKRLIKEINLANSSIDIALYGFGEQKEIFQALINAKNRGVKIRAVTDCTEEELDENTHFPLTKDFTKEFNALCDKRYTLMHNKFFIFDNKKIITGSTNISSTGSGGYNSNIAIVIDDEKIAKIYQEEFEQMYNSRFSKFKKYNYHDFSLSDIAVYFSPKGDVYENAIMPYIKNAKEKIYISAFYLTEKDMINEIISAKKRGLEILIIIDATAANNFREKIKQLRNASIPTAIEDWGGKNHEKTILIDDQILIIGSCNFSRNGFYKNDENIVIIKKPEIARIYKDYFLYLLNSINKKYFYTFPQAEGIDSKNSCFDGIDNNFDGKIDKEDLNCQIK